MLIRKSWRSPYYAESSNSMNWSFLLYAGTLSHAPSGNELVASNHSRLWAGRCCGCRSSGALDRGRSSSPRREAPPAQLRLCTFRYALARACRASYGGPGQEADSGRGQQGATQVPAAISPQARECVAQVMIFDHGCSGIQSICRAGSEVVDRLGPLAPSRANGGRGRMKCGPGLGPHRIHSPARRAAQFFHGLLGFFAKLRRCFRYGL